LVDWDEFSQELANNGKVLYVNMNKSGRSLATKSVADDIKGTTDVINRQQ
jgi:hypothetical protein